MRIIAGLYGGRIIADPSGHRTHPMSERARGALFNSLGDITGLRVLDAFSGSGAVGLEALSRGARELVAVEVDRSAYETTAHNIDLLGAKNAQAVRANVFSWLERQPEQRFNLALADPPYDHLPHAQLPKLVDALAPQGRLVLSWPGKQAAPEFERLEQYKQISHGDLQLLFYRFAV